MSIQDVITMAGTQDNFDVSRASLLDEMQVKLFDSMDRLSGLKISRVIETPQLVVVGAQNSGKSSVLEALVRFHFPVDGAKPTTRFPIKLILRTAKAETTQVRIEPESSRTQDQKNRLHSLAEGFSGRSFDSILKDANAGLRAFLSDTSGESHGNLKGFCKDVLVLDRCGPSLPKLNLVDLPGLFVAVNTDQTDEDRKLVDNMVSRYIESPMNIILLVVSAEVNDYTNVPALGMVQEKLKTDTTLRRRAVCIVTRPDKAGDLKATQDVLGMESKFSEYFARPWHVVRNQDQKARNNHQSLDERDKAEEEFFSKPDWDAVLLDQKGISALRETLKSMMWSHTQDQLPHVISEIEARIDETEALLSKRARERATPEARRTYLGDIAEKFARLTHEAVKGTYENEKCDKYHETGQACQDCKGFFAGFGENSLESQQKRLRANVRALNQAFAAAMRQYGKTKVELEDERTMTTLTIQPLDLRSQQPGDQGQHFQPDGTVAFYNHDKPEAQGRKEYEGWVRMNIDRWKAKGPGGEPSDGAYSGLFAYQAEKWGKIASQHVKAVWQAVRDFIELALADSCVDRDVLESLRRSLVKPNLKRLQLEAGRTLRDLISCHDQSNPGFYDSLIEARAIQEHTKALLQRITAMRPESEDNTETTAAIATSNAEEVNGQQDSGPAQQTNGQSQGDDVLKAQQPVNSSLSGEQNTKDRTQNDTEAFITSALRIITDLISIHPVVNNVFRAKVVPMVAQQISMAFGNSVKEKAKLAEANTQKIVRDLYPSDFGDIVAARVIEQVEMHYEGIRDAFVGYVASLVVEQKIMGQLSKKILTMTLIRDQDEKMIEDIAGEKPEDAKKRKDIERDLKTMREVRQTMEEYINAGHRMAG
ncbi:Dynamin-1-like protein [Cytospora mali]|uniref:Dynamin-1-like protein n=1 Tax=Cytospora mali TaxID=578113 RepID=A0A194V0F4_CYTMA|nr:Dynamin-1-like protein [Valsa mali var. pyri (nom. inval.)]